MVALQLQQHDVLVGCGLVTDLAWVGSCQWEGRGGSKIVAWLGGVMDMHDPWEFRSEFQRPMVEKRGVR